MELLMARGLPFERLENKTLLVAGANSFLASYMIEAVLHYNDMKKNKPCRVIALVRNIEKGKLRFAGYFQRKDFTILHSDVCGFTDYEKKVDVIIHAASQASPKYYGIDPVGTLLPNIIGTHNLLELARKHRSENFLFFSSSEVYGEPREAGKPLDERSFGYLDCMTVRACYAEGKRAGETLCKTYAEKYDMNVKVVRPFHTYGPGMQLDDGRVYADFVKDVVKKEDIVLKSDGSAVRAFCYIRDAADGFFRVLFSGRPGEAYNVASDKDVISVKDLANIVAGLFPERKISVRSRGS